MLEGGVRQFSLWPAGASGNSTVYKQRLTQPVPRRSLV